MSETLKQLQESVAEKRKRLKPLFALSKKSEADGADTYDFANLEELPDWLSSDVEKLEGPAKSLRIVEIVGTELGELDEMQAELTKREYTDQLARKFVEDENTPVKRFPFPDGPGGQPHHPQLKTIGEQVFEHDSFEEWKENGFDPKRCAPIELENLSPLEAKAAAERKTLFETSAGWAPESIRTGRVTPAVTRPLQIIDIMPRNTTGMANVVYMEETTRTHSAAEKAEGAAYAESTFVLTERTSAVRKITDSIPVTDEQLEDVPMVQGYLENRLMFGVNQRLDGQVVAGDGIAPNIDGILNVTGIQTQAKGTDPVPDAIYKGGTNVRVTGRAVPTHVALHPNDAQDIRLTRTADGIYIWGSPADTGQFTIWGWPIIQNESLTENTGLVGSFMPLWIELVERRGIIVEMGFVNDDFTKGRKTLRASGRWAMPVYRPAAFCTVTGI